MFFKFHKFSGAILEDSKIRYTFGFQVHEFPGAIFEVFWNQVKRRLFSLQVFWAIFEVFEIRCEGFTLSVGFDIRFRVYVAIFETSEIMCTFEFLIWKYHLPYLIIWNEVYSQFFNLYGFGAMFWVSEIRCRVLWNRFEFFRLGNSTSRFLFVLTPFSKCVRRLCKSMVTTSSVIDGWMLSPMRRARRCVVMGYLGEVLEKNIIFFSLSSSLLSPTRMMLLWTGSVV